MKRHRQNDVRGSSGHIPPKKTGRSHADHRKRNAPQVERLAHGRRVSSKTAVPKVVADYRDRVFPRLIIIRIESPAEKRRDAQDIPVVAGNEIHVDKLGLAVKNRVDARTVPREHPGEGVVVVAQGLERCVGKIAVSATLRQRGTNEHELLRIFDRQQPQQERIDQTEDGGVGANAESKGEDGDGSEARVLAEHAGGEAKVLPTRLY